MHPSAGYRRPSRASVAQRLVLLILLAAAAGPILAQDTLWLGNDHGGKAFFQVDVFQTDTKGNVLRTIPSIFVTGIAWDGQFLYFGDQGGNITKRSSDGATVVSSFSVGQTGGRPCEDMAWDSKRGRLWRVDTPTFLVRINPAEGRIDATYKLQPPDPEAEVYGIAYNSRLDVLYVSFMGAEDDSGFVSVVNPSTGVITGQLFSVSEVIAGLAYERAPGDDPNQDTLWVGSDAEIHHVKLSGVVLSRFLRPQPTGPFGDGLEFVPAGAVPPPPPPTPGVSCLFVPHNAFLGFHRPELHVSRPSRNPDHQISVYVVADGAPARGADVTVVATQPVFSTSRSQLPSLTQSTARTDDSGRATFVISPPAPSTYDQTNFEATGSAGARPFSCTGSATAGLGTGGALQAATTGPATLSALAGGVVSNLVAPLVNLRTMLRRPLPKSIEQNVRQFDARARRETETVIARLRKNLGQPGLPLTDEATQAVVSNSGQAKSAEQDVGRPGSGVAASIRNRYANVLLSFERNQGQFDIRVRFASRAEGYEVYLTERDALLVDRVLGSQSSVRMRLAGANASPALAALEKLPGRSHYLTSGRTSTNVPQFGKVIYRQAYPGIDLVFHGRQRQLQLDFIVAPGADPTRIALEFDGTDRLELDDSGNLLLHHRTGCVRLEKPFVYQKAGRVPTPVEGKYVLKGSNRAAFTVASYDASRPLVIDPVVSFASYLGGSGGDMGTAIAVDVQGNAYITGVTASDNFPAVGGIQTARSSPRGDVFVTKLNPTGTAVIYSTYIGGTGNDMGMGIAVDSAGSAYVTGVTQSPNFPLVQPIQRSLGAAQPGATDAFVLKLNPSGSAIVYSTYLGGTGEDMGKGIAVDAAGNAYVAGATLSSDFPIKNAYQALRRGAGPMGTDAFIVKLNPAGTDLVYGTYLGGPGASVAAAVAVDTSGNAYVTGATDSAAFPTVAALQAKNGGSQDAFVTKLNPSGAVVYSTYLGGEGDDMGMGIALDSSGNAYITGLTGSASFPVEAPAQPKFGAVNLLGLDAFVTKLSASGSRLVYSTLLGGSGIDIGLGIAVGPDGSAYICGETNSSDFPAVNPIQPASTGSNKSFVARLNPSGSAFTYSATLGGLGHDTASGIAFHPSGIYLVGASLSANFPATYGTYQPISRGRGDATVVKIVEGTPLPRFSGISGATFRVGEAAAPEMIVAGFGDGLAPGIEQAQATPLPTSFLGVSVRVKDAAGKEAPAAPLFFVSPGQINYVAPGGLANGLAAVDVLRGNQTVATGTLRIESVAPGLFSANADGKGVAAAVALRVAAGGAQESRIIFRCGAAAGSCVPAAIDLGNETDQVYLLLFGTGIRGRSSVAAITLTAGGETVPVLGAAAQGDFAGLDQVNAGPLPRTLTGRGAIDLVLTVDGKRANTVTMSVR